MKSTLLFIGMLFLFSTGIAQNTHFEETQKAHMKDPGFELIVSGLLYYTPKHHEWTPASEIHLTYWTTHKWAFGVGYTALFEDLATEHEIAALVSHKPTNYLTINAGPSFSLANEHKETEVSAYIESEFAFYLGEIHIGPTIGTLAGKEFRIYGGMHISYEF